MVEFTVNDVLLKHNNDVLTYAVDSIGNRRFQVYLDIYRSSFLSAEERKDEVTCNKILNDIVNIICTKSVPNGRFLEFDEKSNVWYDVGTVAIPCQRARTGLLGFVDKTTGSEYHTDKPIVEMSKTRRARTMKALHFSEKKLRSVINLSDDRFKVKEEVMINVSTLSSPALEKKVSRKKLDKKHVTFTDSVIDTSKTYERSKDLERSFKKRKITAYEKEHVDVTCGGAGEGILHIDTPGNTLFLSLINFRQKSYSVSNDNEKFQEVCKVIKLMQQICPSCRFVKQKENSLEVVELVWQDIMEKTFHSFCNPCADGFLSDMEIKEFITSFEEKELEDEYISDISSYAPDTIISIENEPVPVETPEDILPMITVDDSKRDEDCIVGEYNHLISYQEQDNYLEVFFPEILESFNEGTAADEFLSSILVS